MDSIFFTNYIELLMCINYSIGNYSSFQNEQVLVCLSGAILKTAHLFDAPRPEKARHLYRGQLTPANIHEVGSSLHCQTNILTSLRESLRILPKMAFQKARMLSGNHTTKNTEEAPGLWEKILFLAL